MSACAVLYAMIAVLDVLRRLVGGSQLIHDELLANSRLYITGERVPLNCMRLKEVVDGKTKTNSLLMSQSILQNAKLKLQFAASTHAM